MAISQIAAATPRVIAVSDTTPPDEWAKLLDQKSVSGQQDLARRMQVSPSTVNRLVRGIGRPSAATVRAAAAVLSDGDTDLIWKMIGTGQFDYGDFPVDKIMDDLRLLTPKQRQSLLAIVKAMADPEGKGVGHVAQSAQKSVRVTRSGAESSISPPPQTPTAGRDGRRLRGVPDPDPK